ncbi:glucose-6-phosphate dehydrogenase [Metabacillus elymi]|uniref:Glucose-6-phosphate 1-dehydrogenase n=1 Tax=Metabacillus elymi TaxID=2745198 RepID=A0ABX6SBP4_9BACI|nr:glucose-6-phosphate dehydrogenase [Metabacillus sp. KUDC1714]QNF30316.1 glucose-6-phosphate dehydrogenase [Metabacillus sp. KUDC1714]
MDAMTFVLFGATGDLAKRKIIPALYSLYVDQKLPPSFSFIGVSLIELSDEEFHENVEQSVHTFSEGGSNDYSKLKDFLPSIRYCKLDVTNEGEYKKLLNLIQLREEELNIPENRMFYMSVAPTFFDVIALNIKKSGLGSTRGWKRLIIEKPFGHDLKSAQELNEKLSTTFQEEEIYRIDHYLGKPMVQNLEALEFANPIFQTLWNNQHIANIQITASETVGVEKRASYYDKAGAIRDMFQNHMMQLLMMTSMHLPKRITAEDIRNEKKKIIESVRPLKKENVRSDVIRGQYGSGEIDGKSVIGYIEEPGITPSSKNDTFVAVRLWIDDPFWQGVPFYIRTGKRMKKKSTRIVIEFKNPLKELYVNQNEDPTPNLLIIGINPNEGVSLQLNSKNPLKDGKIEPINIEFSADQDDVPKAYELLLLDAFEGDATFFAHWKEVELSWKWVQPILEAFEENLVPLHIYPSGSYGPDASHRLLEDDGFGWWLDKKSLESSKVAPQES